MEMDARTGRAQRRRRRVHEDVWWMIMSARLAVSFLENAIRHYQTVPFAVVRPLFRLPRPSSHVCLLLFHSRESVPKLNLAATAFPEY
eukprot:6202258-Pleurochrysis_carterae.AAC.2